MILFHKKTLLLVPIYIAYIILTLKVLSIADADIWIQAFTDKVFVYLIIPPFICGVVLIEESVKRPSLVRMKNRKQGIHFLLFQQYLFGLFYLAVWFLMIAVFVRKNGTVIPMLDFIGKFIRYLLCFFLFINIASCFKRANKKIVATIPFVATYVVLMLDVLAITSITGKAVNIIYLLFSWTFYRKSSLGIVMLFTFFIASYVLLGHFDRKADFY